MSRYTERRRRRTRDAVVGTWLLAVLLGLVAVVSLGSGVDRACGEQRVVATEVCVLEATR